ncbi:PadR family transcriptional regulator [Gryllotalpicola protaetiae]|uniref:PadR family transcriptional regulator n=1 Tax=Gryllotalpicola protaetiae TaxID=2419771 RepID=A0A387BPY2_9MICO|nr:PadR family transcriptional regulator [Gryllotalpicola protaetiae]AYG04124.1 PadR family transcriptional regulator [Gryllotalpicola protaetiae]
MSSPFTGGGARPSLSDAFDQLRSAVEQRLSPRDGRGGDVRAAILTVLAEKPATGGEIITEAGVRSGGSWKPSAGEVYPTLQLLVDEGALTSKVVGGRKTYSLTEEGQAEADAAAGSAAGQTPGRHELFGPLPKAGMELAQAAAQVQRSGTLEQQKQAATLLDEVRRKLYAILAQD